MAIPQRQPRPLQPRREASPRGRPAAAPRRRKNAQHRRFVVLVVVPMLLMLGSVYLHTVSADLGDRVVALEDQRASLQADKEKLEVEVSELSAPGRIRTLARENLGMRAPGAEDLRVYVGEDGTKNAKEGLQEGSR